MKRKSVLFICLLVLSCGFCLAASPKAQVSKLPERLFWVIRGTDSEGNASAVYIQGTIHVGDSRLYPIAPAVLDAWRNADRLVAEVSDSDMASLSTAVQRDMFASYRRVKGKKLYDSLTQEEMDILYTILDGSQIDIYNSFEPWVLNSVVSSMSYADAELDSTQGLDQTFLAMAAEEGRVVLGLDTLRTQLGILEFGTYDEQLYMLRQSIAAFADGSDALQDLVNLYEAYLAGDEELLVELLLNDVEFDEDNRELEEAYLTALFTDRNRAWAKKIGEWLSEGGTTFIFAGTGHFLGDQSVFSFLREDGIIR